MSLTRTYHLPQGDTMMDPTSTNGRRIHGPVTVTITQHADGGRDVDVRDQVLPDDHLMVDLPARFYDDHHDRELPSGVPVRLLASGRRVRVALDREAYDDLLSDARHYSDEFPEYPGLMASARATVRALLRAGADRGWATAA